MVPDLDPECTGSHDQRMVDMERFDSHPPTRSQPDDSCSVRTPGKVFVPLLLSWMKQQGFFTRFRVGPTGLGMLVSIARSAGQTQIVGSGLSFVSTRNDVVNLMFQAGEPRGSLTVLAAISGPQADQFTQRSGNARLRHRKGWVGGLQGRQDVPVGPGWPTPALDGERSGGKL